MVSGSASRGSQNYSFDDVSYSMTKTAILLDRGKLPPTYISPAPTASTSSATIQIFDADGNLLLTGCGQGGLERGLNKTDRLEATENLQS